MKKLIILSFILLLSACSQVSYETISSVDLQNKLKNNDSFVLVLGNSMNCEPCVRYKDVALNEFAKDHEVYLLNIDETKKQSDMDILIEILQEDLSINTDKPVATPSTYLIKDGNLVFSENGPLIYKQLEEKYNEFVRGRE